MFDDAFAEEYAMMAPNVWSDHKFVLAAVKRNGYSLQYAADSLKEDKDVVFAAFKQTAVRANDHVTVKDLVLAAWS